MIKSSRQDWYELPINERPPELAGVPGVYEDDRRKIVSIHRTHLPLIGVLPDNIIPSDTTWEVPRPYQRIGSHYIRQRFGTLLADGLRTGKTCTVLDAHDRNKGSFVVVAPLSTREHWVAWMKRRYSDLTPICAEGREIGFKLLESNPTLLFMHYDILPYWQSNGYLKIDTLVFDEAHLLSNGKSLRTQAAYLLAAQANKVVAMTGTPLWNHPAGLYPLLMLINPGAWGNFKKFSYRYCSAYPGPYGWVVGEPSNVEEFKDRLREVMIRRTWNDIVDDVPKVSRSVELVGLSYEQIFKIDRETAKAQTEKNTVVGELARLRRILGEVKIETAKRLANRVVNELNEPVVVWCWHKDIAKKIANDVDGIVITGDDPIDKRTEYLKAWKTQEKGVLVLTLGVGQVGIDLSHARHSIFAEQDWVPATLGQAEMRTFAVSDEVRFWNKVDKTANCWLWTGCKNDSGYGQIKVNGKSMPAHRFIWKQCYGDIPKSMYVLHKCDVRSCVRPEHLWLGSHTDNMHDMTEKGRGSRGVGEKNNSAKLTYELVDAIRNEYRQKGSFKFGPDKAITGRVTNRSLAKKYGVSRTTIQQVVNEYIWPQKEIKLNGRDNLDNSQSIIYVVADHPVDRAIVKALVRKCRQAERLGTPAAETAIEMLEEALGEDVDLMDLFVED